MRCDECSEMDWRGEDMSQEHHPNCGKRMTVSLTLEQPVAGVLIKGSHTVVIGKFRSTGTLKVSDVKVVNGKQPEPFLCTGVHSPVCTCPENPKSDSVK